MAGILQVPLFPDETLPSWVARLARANGKLSAYSFCGDIGVDFVGMSVGKSTDIEMLGAVTGRDPSELMNHALVLEPGHYVRIAGQVISKKFMRKHQLAFCPRCFADDGARNGAGSDTPRYWRMSWLLIDARACPTHQCAIVALSPHRRMRDLCQVLDQNNDAIEMLLETAVEHQASSMDSFICERLSGDRSHGDLLNDMELGAAIHMARVLGIALTFGTKQTVMHLSDEDVGSAAERGLCILRSGSASVHEALDVIVDSQSGGINSYGRLSHLAFRAGERYGALKDIILSHASNRSVVRSKWMDDRSQPWTSAARVANSTGFTKDKVRRRLWEIGIANTLNSELVPADVLDLFTGEPADFVRSKVGCEIIGCDKEMFDSLDDSGMIKRAFQPNRQFSGKRRFQALFKRSDLIDFRRSVERKALSPKASSMISLRQAARRTGVPKAVIIGKILAGEYKNCAMSGEPLMADNLLIDTHELSPEASWVTASEASRLLDIRDSAFAKLLSKGVIPYRDAAGLSQRFRRKMIDRSAIKAFSEKYVTIAQLVRQTGLDRNTINGMMRSQNIRPAFPPAEFRAAIFLRSKVKKLLDKL